VKPNWVSYILGNASWLFPTLLKPSCLLWATASSSIHSFLCVSFDVPFNISLNEVIVAFLDRGMSTLNIHEVCKGYGGMVVPTPHPEA